MPEPALTADGEERLLITAGQINLVAENRVEFDGEVAFRYGERSISAERASFDLQTETAEVNGTVAYRDPQVTIYGEDASVDTRGRIITFQGGGFELPLRGAQGLRRSHRDSRRQHHRPAIGQLHHLRDRSAGLGTARAGA